MQSFNYGTTASNEITSLGTVGTRQLANTNYGICVEMAPGYCSIEWSPVSANSFTVSNDSVAESLLAGAPTVNGTECRYDFVIIPNAYVDNAAVNADRFCGNTLPTVVSKWCL